MSCGALSMGCASTINPIGSSRPARQYQGQTCAQTLHVAVSSSQSCARTAGFAAIDLRGRVYSEGESEAWRCYYTQAKCASLVARAGADAVLVIESCTLAASESGFCRYMGLHRVSCAITMPQPAPSDMVECLSHTSDTYEKVHSLMQLLVRPLDPLSEISRIRQSLVQLESYVRVDSSNIRPIIGYAHLPPSAQNGAHPLAPLAARLDFLTRGKAQIDRTKTENTPIGGAPGTLGGRGMGGLYVGPTAAGSLMVGVSSFLPGHVPHWLTFSRTTTGTSRNPTINPPTSKSPSRSAPTTTTISSESCRPSRSSTR